ncbi:MAG: amidohydrolase family protein [Actinobacteria bacterium]|nr:amidohydrolase family protein [Actinomycetota bacterium]
MTDQTLAAIESAARDPRRRILLRGGYVSSMDPAIGDLVGDVLIEGSKIAAVGPSLAASGGGSDAVEVDVGGAIVLPGLVDSHTHAWQAGLSGLLPDIDLPEYLAKVHGFSFAGAVPPGLAAFYGPDDMRIGNFVTSLRCLDGGVTCVVDNSHNARTPEHSRGAIEGLREAGIRAAHASGEPLDGTRRGGDWQESVLALRDEYFGDVDGLLTLRVFGLPEPGLWEFAREHDLWTSCETGAWVEADLARLFEAGLMTEKHTFNHCAGLSAEMWSRFAEAGVTANVCARSDSAYLVGDAVPPLAEALAAGVPVGLSMDTEVGYSLDLFAEMRTLLHFARGRSAPVSPGDRPDPPLVDSRQILELATVGGAANAGLADRIGSLSPGKEADVAVIRPGRLALDPPADVAAAVVSYATPADVEAVFVGGVARKWEGRLLGHDLPAVLGELAASRERVLGESGFALDPFGRRAA